MASAFRLRFLPNEIPGLLQRYGPEGDRDQLDIGAAAKRRDSYTSAEFVKICDWKTRKRPRKYYENNDEKAIHEQTEIALTDPDEERRLRAL
jgi:hypothetical protein